MEIDLAEMRRAAHLSQAQLAQALELSQSQVSRYESEPDNIPVGLMRRWLAFVGQHQQAAAVLPPSPSSGVDPGQPYAELWRTFDAITRLADDLERRVGPEVAALPGLPSLPDLRALLGRHRRKPNVLFAGQTDAGKSTLINSLLGRRLLPARYQPTTRLPALLRHLDERPHWARPDERVFLVDGAADGGNVATCLSASGPAESAVLARGGAELLQRWSHGGGGELDADARRLLVVFDDAPLLQACAVLDLPGFQHDSERPDEDAKRVLDLCGFADMLVYVSSIQAFLSVLDLEYLAFYLRALPVLDPAAALDGVPAALANMLIVATHAAPHVAVEQLDTQIIAPGVARVWRQLGDTVFGERDDGLTQEQLRGRVLGFFDERAELREPLHAEFRHSLSERLPRAVAGIAAAEIEAVREAASARLAEELGVVRGILDDRDAASKAQERVLKAEAVREVARREQARELVEAIESACQDATEALGVTWAAWTSEAAIERLVRERFAGADGQREARTQAMPLVLEQVRHAQVLDDRARLEAMEPAARAALSGYELGEGPCGEEAVRRLLDVPFDQRGLFAGVLGAGLAVALGWAIGPILGIAGLFWTLLGESWESRLSRKIAGELRKGEHRQDLETQLRQLWVRRRGRAEKVLGDCEMTLQQRLRQRQELLTAAATERAPVLARMQQLEALRGVFLAMPGVTVERK